MSSIDEENKRKLEFYLKGNALKNSVIDNNGRSIAEHLYGSMILARAIQSEFEPSEDISKVLRMIALEGIALTNDDFKCSEYLANGSKYDKELDEIRRMVTFDSIFASICRVNDLRLHSIINENPDKCFYDLYKEAVRKGIFKPKSFEENKKYQEIFRFYYDNMNLEKTERTGWDNKHWNIFGERESIADHIYGTIVLAMAMYDGEKDVNLDEVLQTLLIHEIGEIEIGDKTPFDITKEEKARIEHKAMKHALGNLTDRESMLNSLLDFDAEEKESSKFAHYCDKLEADIQSKIYQDSGRHRSLDEQQNNVVFKSPRVQKMLQEGANTPFDIWYLYDKDIYKDSEEFKSMLEYIKDHNLRKVRLYSLTIPSTLVIM